MKLKALNCRERYLKAVREEIQQSSCRNSYYRDPPNYNDSFLCEVPRDDRGSVRNCSKTCSDRQRYYLACTAHQDVYAELTKECFGPPKEVGYCLFDKGDFCFLKMNLTKTVLAECYAANPVRNTRIICTPACKRAVISYVQDTGCCIDYWKRYSYSATTISSIFYVCNVQIPKPCTKLSPPAEFLNCAHSKAA